MNISGAKLYELLESQTPEGASFREWLFLTAFPSLKSNPQLFKQINDSRKELFSNEEDNTCFDKRVSNHQDEFKPHVNYDPYAGQWCKWFN